MSQASRACAALTEQIARLDTRYYRLLLIAGIHGSGKTSLLRFCQKELNYPLLNLNLTLSQRLLELKTRQRAPQAQSILGELLTGNGLLLVDNIELLFDPSLQLDPLHALKLTSRHRSLIVAWPGAIEGNQLTYAEPGHPAYRRYDPDDLGDVVVIDINTLSSEA